MLLKREGYWIISSKLKKTLTPKNEADNSIKYNLDFIAGKLHMSGERFGSIYSDKNERDIGGLKGAKVK